jgi:uncharacterized protein YutE (UPF0331/DUF86 family)
MDEIILQKIQTIERCQKRINEVYIDDIKLLEHDYNTQDVILVNIERICQASIDLGNHIIKKYKKGIPSNYKEIFEILYTEKYISDELKKEMQAMVGFRNIAVHDYTNINLEIVQAIVKEKLKIISFFCQIILSIK